MLNLTTKQKNELGKKFDDDVSAIAFETGRPFKIEQTDITRVSFNKQQNTLQYISRINVGFLKPKGYEGDNDPANVFHKIVRQKLGYKSISQIKMSYKKGDYVFYVYAITHRSPICSVAIPTA